MLDFSIKMHYYIQALSNARHNGPIAQLVRAPACHAGGRRFEPVLGRQNALVAQSVEQQTENLPVGGSIPPQGTKHTPV